MFVRANYLGRKSYIRSFVCCMFVLYNKRRDKGRLCNSLMSLRSRGHCFPFQTLSKAFLREASVNKPSLYYPSLLGNQCCGGSYSYTQLGTPNENSLLPLHLRVFVFSLTPNPCFTPLFHPIFRSLIPLRKFPIKF